MTRGNVIEYLILQIVKTVGDDRDGFPTNWGEFSRNVREKAPAVGAVNLKDNELLDALKRLDDGACLSLDKWDNADQSFRPYADYSDDSAFFFRGDFRMRLMPGGRLYFEQLDAAVSPQQPPNRKIGFQ